MNAEQQQPYSFNESDARKFYQWLRHSPNEFTELRVIEWNPESKGKSTQFFVNNEEEFIKVCSEWNGKRQVYAGINPRCRASGTAEDVKRVTGFPFDVDAPTPNKRKQASTEAEVKAAESWMHELVSAVKQQFGIEPYIDFSGNGYRVCLPCDIEVADQQTIDAKLKLFFTEYKEKLQLPDFDNISDLPRIIKVPGGWSLKRQPTEARPHRQALLVQLGDMSKIQEVSNYILGLQPKTKQETPKTTNGNTVEVSLNPLKTAKLRPCFADFITSDRKRVSSSDTRNEETGMRFALVREMYHAGFTKEEILEVCRKFDDYNYDKSEKEVSSVLNEKDSKPFKCVSIHKNGGCIGETCSYYKHKITDVYTIGNYDFKVKGDIILIYKGSDPVCPMRLDSLMGPQNRKNLAKRLEVDEAELDKLATKIYVERKSAPNNAAEEKETQAEVFDEAILSQARDVLASPDFFYRLGEVFEKGFVVPKINKPRFVVGEERNKRLLGPLLIGAAKLGMTSIIKILGGPGTAKDTIMRMWLKLLPIKSVERSYMTAASLRYSPNMQNADLLYIPDSPELQGEMGRQMRFMRSDDGGLVSEYAVRDVETGEMTTKVVALPIKGVATTSNAITGDAALESGMWTLTTDPGLKLTKEVKEEKLKLRAGDRPLISDDELALWRAVFKVLVEEEPQEIPVIPYAEQLADLLESERSESRRDPDKLCDLIGLFAWTRRFQKEPDKRMEADLIDLYFALQLGLDAISQTISELSPKEQQIFEVIKGTVTCRDVVEATKIPYKTCYVYLEKLVDKGYLNQDKEKNRNIYNVLSAGTKPKSLLVSLGRNEESPEELVKAVLATIRNSSTDRFSREDTHSFVDPLKGCKITIRRSSEQDEVTIGSYEQGEATVASKKSVYPPPPPYQRRSSHPSKPAESEPEKKPNSLLPAETGDENKPEPPVPEQGASDGYKHQDQTAYVSRITTGEPCINNCGLAAEWQVECLDSKQCFCNDCFSKEKGNFEQCGFKVVFKEAGQP